MVRSSVRLPSLGGWSTLFRGGLIRGAFATRCGHLYFLSPSCFQYIPADSTRVALTWVKVMLRTGYLVLLLLDESNDDTKV